MSLLSKKTRHLFTAPVRERALEYYDRGAVERFTWLHDGFKALVTGTKDYAVSVGGMSTASPRLDCSCPHFAKGVHCKHLWAAILVSAYEEGQPLDHLDRKASSEPAPTPARRQAPAAVAAPEGAQGATESARPPWMRHFRKIQESTQQPSPVSNPAPTRAAVEPAQENELRYRLRLNEQFVGTRLSVHLEWRRANKSGRWGQWQSLAVGHRSANKPTQTSDREIVALLLQAGHTEPPLSEHESWRTFSSFEIPPLLFGLVLPKLCASGSAWIDTDSGTGPVSEPDTRAMWYRETIPYRFELIGSKESAGGGRSSWRVSGGLVLSQGDQRLHSEATPIAVADVCWVHEGGLVATRDGSLVMAKLDPVDLGWLSVLQREGDLEAPLAETDALIAALYGVKLPARVQLPKELTVEERLGSFNPVLRISVTAPDERHTSRDALQARRVSFSLCFDYPDRRIQADDTAPGWFSSGQPSGRGGATADRVEGASAGVTATSQSTGRVQLIRDIDRENVFVAEVEALLGRRQGAGATSTWLARGQGVTLVYKVDEVLQGLIGGLSEEWLVELGGQKVFRGAVPQLRISSNIDWFELDKTVELETSEGRSEISLPALLRAVKRGGAIEIAGGQAFLDPGTRAKVEAMSSLLSGSLRDKTVQAGTANLRIDKSQFLVLDALLHTGDEDALKLEVDATCERLRASLASFDGVDARTEPPAFQGELREYQRFGLGWMHFLREMGLGGCLADDMGLGKTVQVLALLEAARLEAPGDRRRPFLVVAPKSVVPNWISEIERFCPDMPIIDYTGPGRKRRLQVLEVTPDAMVVTTYASMRIDVATLLGYDFDTIVMDEAQAIKNPTSKTARAARQLRGSHRLALTGTPVENHLGDVVSIFQFLNPGMVENLPALRALAFPQDDDASLELASKALRPLVLRRTKDAVLTELPAKTEQTLYCDLSAGERRNYDELARHYRERLLEGKAKDPAGGDAVQGPARPAAVLGSKKPGIKKIVALEALLRLRQAACHQGLLGQGPASSKLDLLDERLEEVLSDHGHKALVFSQFTSLLAFVKERFDARGWKYAYLDGKTRNRGKVIARFQEDPECRLFLISLKAGGVGLNLTAADYVFLLDPWWNPAAEAQAVDRAHRIGQTKPVMAYRLLARDTVEERVAALQKSKRVLAEALLGADKGLVADMTAEDLEVLLS